MSSSDAQSARATEERVLILAPAGRDALLACQVLNAAGLNCTACHDGGELSAEIDAGAGAVILSEEALHAWMTQELLALLGRQEPWSDLPMLLIVDGGDASEKALAALAPFSNATILERPVRVSTLVSTVRSSLRARRRQYEVRDLLRSRIDADRRKDEFLAMLGHELRNPLAAIRTALFLLDEVGSREAKATRQRQVIERQTGNLVRMVDDLLEVSRVTLGKISLHLQAVNLTETVERCLADLGMAALAQRHGVTVVIETEAVTVDGDPVRLEQVVCNLVQNAVKYTPRGGRLVVSVRDEGGQGVLRVEDTGIGIPREMLPHIFDPFTQVESSRVRSEGGLGLGLPLVRSLVLLHGGSVEAHSAGQGLGSVFVVSLPLRQAGGAAGALGRTAAPAPAEISNPATPVHQDAPAAAQPANDAGRRPGGLRVLVVEDNLDGRESLRELLEIWGFQVDLAATGTEGLEKALAEPHDAALIDIGLPELDGNEVARRIRTAIDAQPIELIAMTGYGQPEDRTRALEAGFDTYLVKPVDPGDLMRLLLDVAHRTGGGEGGGQGAGGRGVHLRRSSG
jgi:signal transduction histidine kinase